MDKFIDMQANIQERENLLNQAFNEGYWDDSKGKLFVSTVVLSFCDYDWTNVIIRNCKERR